MHNFRAAPIETQPPSNTDRPADSRSCPSGAVWALVLSPPAAPPEEVDVGDFSHAQPAEEAAADSAVHAVAATIVDLHDEGTAAGADLDGVGVCRERGG